MSEMMEQKQYEDPVKSPVIQEIIMSNRIGAISMELSKRLNIEPVRALQMFYESQTCADLHNKSTGLYLYGDLYVADEFYAGDGVWDVGIEKVPTFVRICNAKRISCLS